MRGDQRSCGGAAATFCKYSVQVARCSIHNSLCGHLYDNNSAPQVEITILCSLLLYTFTKFLVSGGDILSTPPPAPSRLLQPVPATEWVPVAELLLILPRLCQPGVWELRRRYFGVYCLSQTGSPVHYCQQFSEIRSD